MLAEIAHRKFSELLKTVILQNSCQKICGGVRFDEIIGIDSRPVTSWKRSFHQGGFSVDTSEF